MEQKRQYESHQNVPDLGAVKSYLRALRRHIEDKTDTEHTKEMDELWKKMGTEARHFLFSLQLGSPFFYFPKGAIKKIQMAPREIRGAYWKVMFETFCNYKQR